MNCQNQEQLFIKSFLSKYFVVAFSTSGLKNFTNFGLADNDFNPICLQGKHWEFIKDDFEEAILKYKNS